MHWQCPQLKILKVEANIEVTMHTEFARIVLCGIEFIILIDSCKVINDYLKTMKFVMTCVHLERSLSSIKSVKKKKKTILLSKVMLAHFTQLKEPYGSIIEL